MISTNILAQILGVTFLFVSLSMIFNRKSTALAIDKMLSDSGLLWVLGFISVFIGSTIMAFTNFNGLLNKVLSIMGILSFIKGVYLLWLPGHSTNFYKKIVKRPIWILISGIISLALSIFLVMKGL